MSPKMLEHTGDSYSPTLLMYAGSAGLLPGEPSDHLERDAATPSLASFCGLRTA